MIPQSEDIQILPVIICVVGEVVIWWPWKQELYGCFSSKQPSATL